MQTHTTRQSLLALLVLTFALVGSIGLAARAEAWTPEGTYTCDGLTLKNREGTTAHVQVNGTDYTIPPHGTLQIGLYGPRVRTDWTWEGNTEPTKYLTFTRPGNCAPPTTYPSTPPTTATTPTTVSPPPTSAPCEEGQPCWDCATMGNRICGTTTTVAETTTAPADTTTTPTTAVLPTTAVTTTVPDTTTAPQIVPPTTTPAPTTTGATTPAAPTTATPETAAPVQQTASPAVAVEGTLPRTGAATDIMVITAVGLAVVGGGMILATRRKARHSG